MSYPNIRTAYTLWHQGIIQRLADSVFLHHDIYMQHTRNVAKCAEIIADKCGLDKEKAFVCGLLHDCGKRVNQETLKIFHGNEGYDWMMSEGYDEVAKICLTHTFVHKKIEFWRFNFPLEWLELAQKRLDVVEYDDYDRLIQFCDQVSECADLVCVLERANKIAERYNLTPQQKATLVEDSSNLKAYFDKLCECNVYDLLGIRNAKI